FFDLCLHRGVALSLGKVCADELVCPYHGWRYNTSGACTFIPQLAEPERVPGKVKAAIYHCMERYGLVWVALENTLWPIPEVPELECDEWVVIPCGSFPWRCNASRQVENFTDFGHFAFVHEGLLGDQQKSVVPDYKVITDGNILKYEIVQP